MLPAGYKLYKKKVHRW